MPCRAYKYIAILAYPQEKCNTFFKFLKNCLLKLYERHIGVENLLFLPVPKKRRCQKNAPKVVYNA
jgi:hypothetical protein